MSNDTLRASQAQVDAMIDSEDVPDVLVGDITLDDVRQLVGEMTTAAIHTFGEQDLPEDESEEALRSMVEDIALRVGLICMNIAPITTGIEVPLDSDRVVAVFADLMRSGGVTLTLRVN